MKRIVLGVMYCFLWYISILVGFFLFICPLLPLVFFHPRLYRKWSETVFGMWEPFPVALMEIFFGIRAVLTGDQIDPFERSLLIMNHRTRLDWNFLWVGLFHCCHPYSHALKYVLKSAVMHFPGPGWVMQTCSFLFIHRNWAKDQGLLERLILYLDISDEPYQILIFPEGTDLTPNNIQKSHKFADEHNLTRYYNVLHPKTTGFAFLAHKMKSSGKINAIYDITVGYPGDAPQNETDLLFGNFPEEVHFNVKRYSAHDIPLGQSELKDWLCQVWSEKEKLLSRFHKVGSFSHLDSVPEENGELDSQRTASKTEPSIISQRSCEPPTTQSEVSVQVRERSYSTTTTHDSAYSASIQFKPSAFSTSFRDSITMDACSDAVLSTAAYKSAMDVTYPASASPSCETRSTTSERGTATRSTTNESGTATRSGSCSSGTTVSVPSATPSTRSFINRYRPSHLLYLTFLFWMALIYFTTHQFFVNSYVQMWVLVHAIFFSSISLLSDGFQHVIATIYFYRYNIKSKRKRGHR